MINLVTSALARAIASTRLLLSPHRAADAPKGDLFAGHWSTTLALMAVNVSLVAVLVSAPPAAEAQDLPSIPICSRCYEGWESWNRRWVHSTKSYSDLEPVIGGMTFHHRNDGRYTGTCWGAHPDAKCCDPDDEGEDGVD